MNPGRDAIGFRSQGGIPAQPVSQPPDPGSLEYVPYNFQSAKERDYFQAQLKGIVPAYGFTDEHYTVKLASPGGGVSPADHTLYMRRNVYETIRAKELEMSDAYLHL